MSTAIIQKAHPVSRRDEREAMSQQTHPDCYGPNYRNAKEEARATGKQRRLSWVDAWAFSLLLMCILAPVFYFLVAVR